MGYDSLNKVTPAARYENVHLAAGLHERVGAFAAILVDGEHSVGGEPGGFQRFADNVHERRVGVCCGASAPQDYSVPALQCDSGDIHTHVRPCLVDRRDDPERNADLAKPDAVGQSLPAHNRPDGIGQASEFLQRLRQSADALSAQAQAIQQSGGCSLRPAIFQILPVGVQDRILVRQQGGGNGL